MLISHFLKLLVIHFPMRLLSHLPAHLLSRLPTHLLSFHLLSSSPHLLSSRLLSRPPTHLLSRLPAHLLSRPPTHLLSFRLLGSSSPHLLSSSSINKPRVFLPGCERMVHSSPSVYPPSPQGVDHPRAAVDPGLEASLGCNAERMRSVSSTDSRGL
jgi:hypothetical protein